MLMAEYDYEMDVAVQREEAYQDGVEEGRAIRELKYLIRPIVKKLKKGHTAERIADDLEEPLENVKFLIAIAKRYAPEYNENDIWDEILKEKRLKK